MRATKASKLRSWKSIMIKLQPVLLERIGWNVQATVSYALWKAPWHIISCIASLIGNIALP